jgi:integrase
MGNQTKNPSSGWTERNLSDDQIARIVEKANVNPKLWDLRDIAQLLADTGLRGGELVVLRWSDVNMAKSRISVQNSISLYGRYVPFGPRAAEALESLRQRRPGSELVLGGKASRLLRRCALQLKELAAEIGIPHAGLHAFRRAAISRGVASGIAFNTLARRFGFSDPTSIARLYLNSDAEANRRARIREKVQALFRS